MPLIQRLFGLSPSLQGSENEEHATGGRDRAGIEGSLPAAPHNDPGTQDVHRLECVQKPRVKTELGA